MALPISVTYTFATATSAIPLSQLDANFTTVVNGINGIGNGTNSLSNVSITGGNVAVTTANATTINATTLNAATLRSDTSLTFQSNGTTTAMTIDTSQNVGIGTSSPASKLGVTVNTANGDGITVTNSNNSGYFTLQANGSTGSGVSGWANSTVFEAVPASTGGLVLGTYSGNMIFQTGARNERMRIDSSGNVGIGTISPVGRLGVVNTGNNSQISIGDTAVSSYSTLRMYGGSGHYNFQLGVQNNVSNAFEITPSTAAGGTTFSTPAMVVDSSGNVGIGTASPTYRLQVATSSYPGVGFFRDLDVTSVGAAGQVIEIGARNGATFTPGASINGVLENPATTGYMSFLTRTASSLTEKMRIDSSGNVGIGTSSVAAKLDVRSGSTSINTLGVNSSLTTAYSATGYNGATARILITGGGASGAANGIEFTQGGSSELFFGQVQESGGAGAFVFQGYSGSAYSERARIDSSGNLLVGTTSVGGSGGITINPNYQGANTPGAILTNKTASGTYNAYLFRYNGSNVGSITYSDSAVAYNTTSDHRLKRDVEPMLSGLATVAALKPVNYKWNVDNSDGEGFIAHELQEVVPLAVTGEKDAVDADGKPIYQGVDYSKIVVHLVAAVQEQQAQIEQLKARVAALETK